MTRIKQKGINHDPPIIHWERIDNDRVVSEKDTKAVKWLTIRTGRIGMYFEVHHGVSGIRVYEEFVHSANVTVRGSKDLLSIDGAREIVDFETIFPSLDKEEDSNEERLISVIAENAASGHLSRYGISLHVWPILIWAIGNDSSFKEKMKERFPSWVKEVELMSKKKTVTSKGKKKTKK